MAKKKKTPTKAIAKPKEPSEIIVKYCLSDLPTAFHKAGLAGLVMLIESLKERLQLSPGDVEYSLTPTTVTVTYTESLLQTLMNDLYDAQVVEVRVKSKWQGATPKREESFEEEINGKKVKTKRFIYDQVQPKGAFFDAVFGGDKEIWRKLWRDMIWNIPRGRPTTRIPYNERAAGKNCREGATVWKDLLRVQKSLVKGIACTTGISSALLPGAQAANAEGITFEGRVEQNVLLHFWPLAVLLFVPQLVDSDGSTEFVGYCLAVPEVSNLEQFVYDYPNLMNSLSKDARGYRPAQAVIDLPAEGALLFMERLASISGLQIESSGGKYNELRFSISGAEYLHLVKVGNNIKTMAAGRVTPKASLLAEYLQIISLHDASHYFRDPLFRRGLLDSLFAERSWHSSFAKVMATRGVKRLLRQPRRGMDEEKKRMPQFCNDAAKKIKYETKLFTQSLEGINNMPDVQRPRAPLAVIINRVVRSYLLTRTKEKTGIDPEKFRTVEGEIDYKKIPPDFNEGKQKLAQSLFLEFRSRKDQALVDHFAATFFSVSQRIGEADRLQLAEVMMNSDSIEGREDLKTLTLLSLSANS